MQSQTNTIIGASVGVAVAFLFYVYNGKLNKSLEDLKKDILEEMKKNNPTLGEKDTKVLVESIRTLITHVQSLQNTSGGFSSDTLEKFIKEQTTTSTKPIMLEKKLEEVVSNMTKSLAQQFSQENANLKESIKDLQGFLKEQSSNSSKTRESVVIDPNISKSLEDVKILLSKRGDSEKSDEKTLFDGNVEKLQTLIDLNSALQLELDQLRQEFEEYKFQTEKTRSAATQHYEEKNSELQDALLELSSLKQELQESEAIRKDLLNSAVKGQLEKNEMMNSLQKERDDSRSIIIGLEKEIKMIQMAQQSKSESSGQEMQYLRTNLKEYDAKLTRASMNVTDLEKKIDVLKQSSDAEKNQLESKIQALTIELQYLKENSFNLAQQNDSEIKAKNARNHELEDRIAKLTQQVSAIDFSKDQVNSEKKDLYNLLEQEKKKNQSLETEMKDLKGEMNEKDKLLMSHEKEIQSLTVSLDRKEAKIVHDKDMEIERLKAELTKSINTIKVMEKHETEIRHDLDGEIEDITKELGDIEEERDELKKALFSSKKENEEKTLRIAELEKLVPK